MRHLTRVEIAVFVWIVIVGGTMAAFGAPLWAFYVGVVVTSLVSGYASVSERRARDRARRPPTGHA
jgi:membrane protein implicated in regulation of membrane protease activity